MNAFETGDLVLPRRLTKIDSYAMLVPLEDPAIVAGFTWGIVFIDPSMHDLRTILCATSPVEMVIKRFSLLFPDEATSLLRVWNAPEPRKKLLIL